MVAGCPKDEKYIHGIMRILIATGIYPPDIGGPATYSYILKTELPKRGVEVEILSFGEVRYLPKVLRHFVYFLKAVKKGRDADIIFAQDPVSVGLLAFLAAKILRKKFLLKIVGDYAWEQGVQRFGVKESLDEFLKRRYLDLRVGLLRRFQEMVARGAKKIIVPSYYLKGIVQTWGVWPDKISVIYNTFKQPRFTPRREARTRLGVGENEIILFSPGRNVPWKGFRMLQEIEPEIQKRFPTARIVLGTFDKETYDLWLMACDLFLQNTGYEGFSHQILEAMALGLPIITTNAGGNREIVENNKNALVVEYNNKEAWIRAINMLLENPALRETISKGAKETAQKFLNKDMVGETLKVLEDIK